MHRLRLAVPAVALALALPAGVAALSPIPTVPLYATGSVLSCYGDGGCAYVLTVQHEDWGPEAIELELLDDGSTVTLDGVMEVPVGTLAVTVDGRYISDAVENGRREVGPTFVRCDLVIEVPDDARGVELAVAVTHRACVLDAAPSERGGPEDAADPVSPILSLHRIPDTVDPAMALPPFFTATPASPTGVVIGVPFASMLGHCGLSWPLDIDGSLWDPVGAVDATLGPVDSEEELGELINATEVEALLVTADRLDVRTPLGTVLVMARHAGAGDYPLCD